MNREKKFKEFIQNGEEPFMYEKNILCEHWDRVEAIMKGKETSVYEVEIQPSATCNLQCKHCVGIAHKPKGVVGISPMKMKLIIEHIAKIGGVKRIKFSGYYGEPLMNKKSTLVGIRTAKRMGMKVGLFTNGILIDEEVMNTILGIEYVNISLDAGSKESYLKMKGINQFYAVIMNIKTLDAIRKKRKSRLEITVGYILNKENYKEIPQIIKLLKNHINMIRFKVNILNDDMNKDELDEAYELIEESRRHENKKFKIIRIHSRLDAERTQKPTFEKCYFLNFMGCIGCDGKAYPCDHKTYFGGDKKDLVPKRDCELCPPMGFRVNRLLEFMENEYKKDPKFLDWVESYIRSEFK